MQILLSNCLIMFISLLLNLLFGLMPFDIKMTIMLKESECWTLHLPGGQKQNSQVNYNVAP